MMRRLPESDFGLGLPNNLKITSSDLYGPENITSVLNLTLEHVIRLLIDSACRKAYDKKYYMPRNEIL